MSFIELPGIDEVTEPEIRPTARYPLVITGAKIKPSKEKVGHNNIEVVIGFDDDPEEIYIPIFQYLALPHPDDEVKSRRFKLRNIKSFCQVFGITVDGGINVEEFVGSRGECNVKAGDYEGRPKHELVLPAVAETD